MSRFRVFFRTDVWSYYTLEDTHMTKWNQHWPMSPKYKKTVTVYKATITIRHFLFLNVTPGEYPFQATMQCRSHHQAHTLQRPTISSTWSKTVHCTLSFPGWRQAARKQHLCLYWDITSRAPTHGPTAHAHNVMNRLHRVASYIRPIRYRNDSTGMTRRTIMCSVLTPWRVCPEFLRDSGISPPPFIVHCATLSLKRPPVWTSVRRSYAQRQGFRIGHKTFSSL